jgi:hypothetical protein
MFTLSPTASKSVLWQLGVSEGYNKWLILTNKLFYVFIFMG